MELNYTIILLSHIYNFIQATIIVIVDNFYNSSIMFLTLL